jgi:hypothetical protein
MLVKILNLGFRSSMINMGYFSGILNRMNEITQYYLSNYSRQPWIKMPPFLLEETLRGWGGEGGAACVCSCMFALNYRQRVELITVFRCK